MFGGKIDLIFFDATTLYFESFTEDELKQNGFSKDHKFGQPQVLLALMVTEQGIPIGYEVFPGSTYEGHTLIPMLESIKERYNLGKVVFVADSGLLNAANLQAMEDSGFKYIVGVRLRKMKPAFRNESLIPIITLVIKIRKINLNWQHLNWNRTEYYLSPIAQKEHVKMLMIVTKR